MQSCLNIPLLIAITIWLVACGSGDTGIDGVDDGGGAVEETEDPILDVDDGDDAKVFSLPIL